MKYNINISYQTGNSFNSEDTESWLDLSWENLDNAKKNLKWIKEHHDMYKRFNGWGSDNFLDHWEEYENKKWFVYEERYINKKTKCAHDKKDYDKNPELFDIVPDETMALNCMKLQADNGNYMQQWNFWIGYFETLYGAEIVNVDSDLSFEV